MTNAHPPVLWLLRHNRTPVCLVAATNRDTACRIGHELAPDIAHCDFSALHVGTPKNPRAGVVADLRMQATTDEDGNPLPRMRPPPKRRRHATGHAPTDKAPSAGLECFEAVCRHVGIHEVVARNSHSPVATRVRWATWSAVLTAGYNQREAGAVTGHSGTAVSKTVIGIENKTLKVDASTLDLYAYACAAMRLAVTGEETSPSPGDDAVLG